MRDRPLGLVFSGAIEARAVGGVQIHQRKRIVGELKGEERRPVGGGEVGGNLQCVGDADRAADVEFELC